MLDIDQIALEFICRRTVEKDIILYGRSLKTLLEERQNAMDDSSFDCIVIGTGPGGKALPCKRRKAANA